MRWALLLVLGGGVLAAVSGLPARRAVAQGAGCLPAASHRYVILLHGFNSSSLVDDTTGAPTPANHRVRDDFRFLREALVQGLAPAPEVIYFSYGAARQLARGAPPAAAWAGDTYRDESEPRYAARDTTDLPLAAHAAALGWLVRELLRCDSTAVVHLVGFSLGGVVAVRWVADEPEGPDSPLRAVRRVVLLDSPLGGINGPLLRQAVQLVPAAAVLLGDGTMIRDLASSSELLAATREAAQRVDLTAIESSGDFVVNGAALLGGAWLGRGLAAGGGALGAELELRRLDIALPRATGGSLYERVLALHALPLHEPAVREALLEALHHDGPRWQARRGAQPPPTPISPARAE
jgi:pimeloyl-ACP methyl ester carboxylesterase